MQYMQSELMANVVGWIMADPEPQPNQIPPKLLGRNLVGLLANKGQRLKSALAVRERIMAGLGGLEAEIERLSP